MGERGRFILAAISEDRSPQQEVEAAIEMVYEILWRFEINAKRPMTAEEFKARIPRIVRACDTDVMLSAETSNLAFAVGR